jgi:hypothetical protein
MNFFGDVTAISAPGENDGDRKRFYRLFLQVRAFELYLGD